MIMERKIVAVALLSLISMAVSEDSASAKTGWKDFKCQCIATHSKFIHPRYIESVHVIGIRPHCENVEIIATLKGGREVCLEPTAPWVKLVTKAIWNTNNKAESPV